MALKLGTLDVDLEINTQQLTKAEKKVSKSTKAMTASFNKLGAALAGVFATQQLIQMVKTTDQMRVLEGRIRRVTKTAEGFGKAWKAINQSADEAGVSINDSAASFERFLQATEGMGASIEQVGRFNDLILKTGRISGASSQELSNSLTQLSQGFSGGIIRAEEWNSIIEQAPEILRVAARNIDGVNGDLGELRKLMLDGGLTADKFFNAFMAGADDIEKEFAKVPRSIEQNMQELSNQWTRLLISMDKALGITQKLAGAFKAIADGLGKEDTALDMNTRKLNLQSAAIARLTKERAELKEELKTADPMFRGIKEQRVGSIDKQIADLKLLQKESQKVVDSLTPKEQAALAPLKAKPQGEDEAAAKTAAKAAKLLAKQKQDAQDYLDELVFRTSTAADQLEIIWNEESLKLESLNEKKLISEQEFLAARKTLNLEYIGAVEQLEKDAAEKRNQRNQDQVNSIAQMSTAISATLSSIGDDSTGGLATAASAFSKFATSIIATSQAMAAAQALADPTALTMPQKLANYATILTSFASIAGMLAGGRVNGGGMQEGSMYAINEGGKSEILEEGGKQFLLAGKNASITGNGAMKEVDGSSASVGMTVNIVNNITGTDDELNRKLGETVTKAIKGAESNYIRQMSQKNGKMFASTQQNYGSGRTTGRPM